MKKFLKLLSLGVAVALASCMMDPSGGKKNRQPETLSAEMSLTVPGSFNDPATRALTDAQECAVEDAYVLVFSATNELEAMVEIAADKIRPNDQTKVTLSAELPSGSHRLAVIVNAAALIESALGTDASAVADKSYAGVMGKLTQTIDGKMFASGGVIPMWGETPEAVTIATASHFDIDLVRSIARVDVGVGKFENGAWDDMDIPFTITEVYLMRPVKGYSVVPDAAKFAADEPSLPTPAPGSFTATESEAAFAFTDNITGGKYLSQNIYTPETPVAEVHHLEQTALVVGGKYGTSEAITYYRLNFADSEGTLVEVQRNHLYRFQISEVLGMGYEDPATAYNAYGQSKMKATVLDWDDELFEDITFVGDSYISLGSNPLTLEPYDGFISSTAVKTNLYGGFEMFLGAETTAKFSSTGAIAAGAAGQSVTTAKFTYTLTKDAGNTEDFTLEVTTLGENFGSTDFTETWRVVGADEVIVKELVVRQPAGIRPESYAPSPAGEFRIGNLIWAGSNVDVPRTFAANAQDYGRIYHFASAASAVGTRLVGWTGASNRANLNTMGTNAGIHASGQGVAWDAAAYYPDTPWSSTGGWLPEADPCAQGWRLPTRDDWASLDSGTTIVAGALQTVGGINGREFTIKEGIDTGKKIFMAATGTRYNVVGMTGNGPGSYGFYWSSSANPSNTEYTYSHNFFSGYVALEGFYGTKSGFAVRCVRTPGGNELTTYTVSASETAGGTADVIGSSTLAAGQLAQVEATVTDPTSGHAFSHWTATGVTLTEEQAGRNPLVFPMPAGAVTLTANFAAPLKVGTLTWAASNVDAPGKFAAKVDDYGRYYSFASAASPTGVRMVGWSSEPGDLSTKGTNAGVNAQDQGVAWNATYYPELGWAATGDWLPEANPCPTGWRVPTQAEWQTFYTGIGGTVASSTWGDVNGVNGRTFTIAAGPDAGKTIFLPAAGYRNGTSETLRNQGLVGIYWAATATSSVTHNAYSLGFDSPTVTPERNNDTRVTNSVRCVKGSEVQIIDPEPPYIIYWDAATQTMQLGSWKAGPGGAVTQANMLFFQFGSTIGFLNQNDSFDASDIKFNLTTDTSYTSLNNWTDWFTDNSITYAAATHGVDGYVSSSAYHSASNVQTGRGDPCKLVGLTLAQIKAGTIDNGKWRMPTLAEQQAEGWAEYTGYGAYPTVNTINTPAGVRNSSGGFLPAAGDRLSDGATYAVGRGANFWVSRPNSATSGYDLNFYSGNVYPALTVDARRGFGVRCLSSDIDTRGSADNWGNGGEHDLRR